MPRTVRQHHPRAMKPDNLPQKSGYIVIVARKPVERQMMKIEIVNEYLGIVGLNSIEDLGEVQVWQLKKQYGGNTNLSRLTFFYMPDRDWIVINKSHPKYDMYLQIIEAYLLASQDGRNEAHERALTMKAPIKSALYILDGVIADRKRICSK